MWQSLRSPHKCGGDFAVDVEAAKSISVVKFWHAFADSLGDCVPCNAIHCYKLGRRAMDGGFAALLWESARA